MSLAWSGSDRVGLWRVVAALAIATAIDLGLSLHTPSVVPPHPEAPSWLLAIASSSVVTIVLVLLVVGAAMMSARRAAAIWPTALWIAALALLAESAAAAGPGPYRGWTFVGAVGSGIVVGRGWARLATRGTTGDHPRFEARCGELGAVASLVACYVGAATSKLGGTGLGWADATTLQAVALAHAHIDRPGLASLLLDAPTLATALGWATLLVQVGAVGLLFERTRVLATIGLVGFHVGVAVFARIGYWSAVVLVLAVGLPWSRWLARGREVPQDPEGPTIPDRTADLAVGGVLALLVAVAWLGPWRSYSDGHHRSRTLAEGASAVREPITRFGPLTIGDTFDMWQIVGLEREPTRVMVILDHGSHPRVVLWVSRRDASEGGNSPFDRGALRIAYEPPLPPEVSLAAKRLADVLSHDPTVLEQLR